MSGHHFGKLMAKLTTISAQNAMTLMKNQVRTLAISFNMAVLPSADGTVGLMTHHTNTKATTASENAHAMPSIMASQPVELPIDAPVMWISSKCY